MQPQTITTADGYVLQDDDEFYIVILMEGRIYLDKNIFESHSYYVKEYPNWFKNLTSAYGYGTNLIETEAQKMRDSLYRQFRGYDDPNN